MNRPVPALSQSYLRTKARNLKEYRAAMELHANSSNNTVYSSRTIKNTLTSLAAS